jgi:hypothetical protein
METTEVSDTRTAGEIQQLLAERGASSIQVDYLNGRVEGLSFCFKVGEHQVPFRLPCRWKSIVKALGQSGKRVRKNDTLENWGRRVAWRQILRWVQAQLAMIETDMVKTEEVFMPYAILPNQKTMYEAFAENKFLLADKTGEAPTTQD